MKSAIKFLEEMGKNADLRLDRIDFEAILNNEDFDAETRKAIINKDKNALELLLDARSKIVCMIATPEDEEDDEGTEDDSKKEKEISKDSSKRLSKAS